MYKKNIVFLIFLIFILGSCETFDQVKRGLSGEKDKSTDEFLVKKKDPLVLPPNYSELPSPEDIIVKRSSPLPPVKISIPALPMNSYFPAIDLLISIVPPDGSAVSVTTPKLLVLTLAE